jgi:hypothetical protein
LNSSDFTDNFAAIFTIILINIVIMVPPIVLAITIIKFKYLRKKYYRDKIGALYEEIDVSTKWKALYHFFFVMRRIILAVFIIFS